MTFYENISLDGLAEINSADSQILAVELRRDTSQLRLYQTKNGQNVPLPLINQDSRLYFTNNSDVLLQEEKLEQRINNQTIFRVRLSLLRITDGNAIWVGNWRNEPDQDIVFSPDGSVFARNLANFGNFGKRGSVISSVDTRTGESREEIKIPAYTDSCNFSLI